MSNTTKITLTNEATIHASGKKRTKAAKPVFCISTGEVYASALDAAEASGVTIHAISACCLGKIKTSCGKRWCYIKDIENFLEEIATNMQTREVKIRAYDEIMHHQTAIDDAQAKVAKHKAAYDKLQQKLTKEFEALTLAQAELEELTRED